MELTETPEALPQYKLKIHNIICCSRLYRLYWKQQGLELLYIMIHNSPLSSSWPTWNQTMVEDKNKDIWATVPVLID